MDRVAAKKDMKARSYRAAGGEVEEGDIVEDTTPEMVYAGGDSNVVKEAKDRSGKFKKGGKVSAFVRGKMSEGMEKKMKKDGGSCEGMEATPRLDRAKRAARATGGPLSTASKTSERPDFKGAKNVND
jgi:hypothetical protein